MVLETWLALLGRELRRTKWKPARPGERSRSEATVRDRQKRRGPCYSSSVLSDGLELDLPADLNDARVDIWIGLRHADSIRAGDRTDRTGVEDVVSVEVDLDTECSISHPG